MAQATQGVWDEELQFVLNHVPNAVLCRDLERFNKNGYRSSLAAYTQENRETFERLQRFCTRHPHEAEETLRLVSRTLLDAVEQELSNPQKYRRINERALRLDTCRMVIVVYLTPAVLGMGLEIGEPFVRTLRGEWLKRHPRQSYELVTGEMVAEGFERKWYQCYITQAVCLFLGKPDDCQELAAFRRFRDTYLSACPGGTELIAEYYRDAPQIVARLWLSGYADRIYPRLWERDLLPCLRDIENGRLQDCRDRYVRMMRRLQRRFLGRGGGNHL